MLDMKKVLVGVAVAASGLVSTQALAETTGSLNLTSEYMFRGIVSEGGAAVQGSLDWSSPSGVYAGTWASNAAVAGGNELDLYFGWAGEMSGGLGVDLGIVGYFFTEGEEANGGATTAPQTYSGDGDYFEAYIGLSFGGLSGSVYYATDYFGVDGEVVYGGIDNGVAQPNYRADGEALYWNLSYTASLKEGLDLTAQVGINDGDGVEAFIGDEYTDWSITLSKDLGDGWGASFAYVQTDLDLSPDANNQNATVLGAAALLEDEAKFVVSLSKEFAL